MEILIKMDDLGGKPTIFGNIQMFFAMCWMFFEKSDSYHPIIHEYFDAEDHA